MPNHESSGNEAEHEQANLKPTRLSRRNGSKEPNPFEITAIVAYCSALNALDAERLAPLLAEQFTYNSHWVMDVLVGREPFLAYFRGKLETIRKNDAKVWAELAEVHAPPGSTRLRPCAVVAQNKRENRVAVVLANVNGDRLTGLSMTTPTWFGDLRLTGEYPGLAKE